MEKRAKLGASFQVPCQNLSIVQVGARSRTHSAGENPRACIRCWVRVGPTLEKRRARASSLLATRGSGGVPERAAADTSGCLSGYRLEVRAALCSDDLDARSRGGPGDPEEAVETMHKSHSPNSEVIRA